MISSVSRFTPPAGALRSLAAAALCLLSLPLTAQVRSNAMPPDPSVRTGFLPNGMRYYIRENHEPANRAELRLAVNAGSMQEEDNQLGLAHFCEHMCFNGSAHFNKSALVDYLESIGTKFGAHLNAYTSFDETVYMLQVPTDNAQIMDKAFLVLEDWASGVTFEDGEIDKERGVVIEEWRLGLGADERMRDRYFPVLFNGSRYADRLPIGKKEILETFAYERVRSFYKDWYRPDLMAVIAVGDFDGAAMEARIKEQFSKLKNPANPRKRELYPVPDHDAPLAAVERDPEAAMTVLQLMYKHPNAPQGSREDYRSYLVSQLATNMLTGRLMELKQKPGSPFIFAGAFEGNMIRTQSSFMSVALLNADSVKKGANWLMTEVERARRHGFTAPELERARKDMMKQIEKAFSEKDKTPSNQLTQEYIQHFLQGTPFPGIAAEKAMYEEFLPGITLEEINARLQSWVTEKNHVIILTGPERKGLTFPTGADLIAMEKQVRAGNVEPYVEVVDNGPLVQKTPAPGTVKSEKTVANLGVTEWTLSNGVRVVLKPTDFKNDEILMSAFSRGGHSRFGDKDFYSGMVADNIMTAGGVGRFSVPMLEKRLAGKEVEVMPWIQDLFEGFDGSCAPADFTTMMELVYLYFTQPRQDPEAFAAFQNEMRMMVTMSATPEGAFQDSVNSVLHGRHWRYQPMTEDKINKLNLQKASMAYFDRFSDASDFTFVFVGNFDPAGIRPHIEKWLGALPNLGRKESFKDLGANPLKGNVSVEVKKGSEPKSMVNLSYTGTFTWNGQSNFEIRSMMRVLNIMLRESMREDKGGVYGVRANVQTYQFPTPMYRIDIGFGCAPENVETLIQTAMNDIKTLQESGASEKNLVKVKETYRRERETDLRSNEWWRDRLVNTWKNGDDPSGLLELEKALETLTTQSVSTAARTYFKTDNCIRVVMKPVN